MDSSPVKPSLLLPFREVLTFRNTLPEVAFNERRGEEERYRAFTAYFGRRGPLDEGFESVHSAAAIIGGQFAVS
jgi:hypothetical protein